MQKQTEGYLQGDHRLRVQRNHILTTRVTWRVGRLNPRKVPLPGRGVTSRDKHWLGIPGQVGLHRAGSGQAVLLPLQEWGCLVFPLSQLQAGQGLYFSWLFFHMATSLRNTGLVWEAAAAGTCL